VNCAAIPTELIESDLFGHIKGSFTGAVTDRVGKFELADGGTLFLDEIGDMSLSAQAKVLRALQEGVVTRLGGMKAVEVDVRVLAATNKDVEEEIAEGRFREDLFYRINVVPIVVPPLSDRREDIPDLIKHFASQLGGRPGMVPKTFASEAIERLQFRVWPGNVRELRNAVERLLILSADRVIRATDVDRLLAGGGESATLGEAGAGGTFEEFREESEKVFLERKLREYQGNVTKTARAINMPRSYLYKKLTKYGIERSGK
ncbi:MAG: sigma-54 dependent transcriptional regulator, partial [Gemmatimonadota bacterium]